MLKITFQVDHFQYELSNTGILKNLTTNRVLKGYKQHPGYRAVTLGNNKRFLMHRLLANYFIPNPNNYPEINHKDGNKMNNHLSNLEWVTSSENIRHAFSTGLSSKLPIVDYSLVPSILQEFYSGIPIIDLINKYDISEYSAFRKLLKREAIRKNELDLFNNAAKQGRLINHTKQSKAVENSNHVQYPSLHEAARQYSCSPASIYKAIKANRPYKGIYWKYV